MANRYSRIFHHISTQDLKRNQKEEQGISINQSRVNLCLRKIEDNKVLIEEEQRVRKRSYVKNLQQKNQIGEMI